MTSVTAAHAAFVGMARAQTCMHDCAHHAIAILHFDQVEDAVNTLAVLLLVTSTE